LAVSDVEGQVLELLAQFNSLTNGLPNEIREYLREENKDETYLFASTANTGAIVADGGELGWS
jgi:UV DNA damage repair endonuclease